MRINKNAMIFKKILAVITFLYLILPCSVATASKGIYHTYYYDLNENYEMTFYNYDDSYFSGSNQVINADLARSSIALSSAAYIQTAVSSALSSMSFYDIEQADYRDTSPTDNDFVSATFAYKSIINEGKIWDLYAIIIRGTGKGYDWLSNYNIGIGQNHAGFSLAESILKREFAAYYQNLCTLGHTDEGISNNKIWITGHSRGAAVANLLAADFSEGNSYVSESQIFAYTFACPAVTTESESAEHHPYIFNFNNTADFVCCVPLAQWKYRRYGVTVYLDEEQSLSEKMTYAFRQRTGFDYRGIKKADTEEIVDLVERLSPSVTDYYTNWLSDDYSQYYARVGSPYGLFSAIGLVQGGKSLISNIQWGIAAVGESLSSPLLASSLAWEFTAHWDGIEQAHCPAAYLSWMDAYQPVERPQQDAITTTINTPSDSAQNISLQRMKQLLGMTANDAAVFLGGYYSYDSTGAEASQDGYQFPDYGITLSFSGDPASALVTSIYCWEGTSIGDVMVGMSTNEISGIIGSPAYILSGDDFYPYDTYNYYYGDLLITFIQNGGGKDLTFYAIVSLWRDSNVIISETPEQQAVITDSSIRDMTNIYQIDVVYPVVSGLYDFENSNAINTAIQDGVNHMKVEVIESAKNENPDSPYTLKIRYQILRNDRHILSLLLDIHIAIGGAHGAHEAYCINAINDRLITLGGLFADNSDYQNFLYQCVDEQLADDQEWQNDYDWSAPDCCAKTRVSKCRLSA